MCNEFDSFEAIDPMGQVDNSIDCGGDIAEENYRHEEYMAWLAKQDEQMQEQLDAEAEAEMSRYDDDPSPYNGDYYEDDGF